MMTEPKKPEFINNNDGIVMIITYVSIELFLLRKTDM